MPFDLSCVHSSAGADVFSVHQNHDHYCCCCCWKLGSIHVGFSRELYPLTWDTNISSGCQCCGHCCCCHQDVGSVPHKFLPQAVSVLLDNANISPPPLSLIGCPLHHFFEFLEHHRHFLSKALIKKVISLSIVRFCFVIPLSILLSVDI